MGRAARRKWQNRHARRVLDLVQAGEKFEPATKLAFKEIQNRKFALRYLRSIGLGLKALREIERNAVKPVIQSKAPVVEGA